MRKNRKAGTVLHEMSADYLPAGIVFFDDYRAVSGARRVYACSKPRGAGSDYRYIVHEKCVLPSVFSLYYYITSDENIKPFVEVRNTGHDIVLSMKQLNVCDFSD